MPPGIMAALTPPCARKAHDLRSQVGVKGVENEQIRLEDPGIKVQLFDKLFRVFDEAGQHLGNINGDDLKVRPGLDGLEQALAVLSSFNYANQHESRDDGRC